MIHDNYTIIKLQQTLKIINLKTKQPQPSIKKPFFFFKINSTIPNHIRKVETRKKNSKYKLKKTSEQNKPRALGPCTEALESLDLGATVGLS
jgi:hypothetical protein